MSTNLPASSYTSNFLEFHFAFQAVATEIWAKTDVWSNTFYAKQIYKSQRKKNHSRENLPSSVAPDGKDKGMLCTPAQQRGSFITVIYTCPKGAQFKLMWRFFSDSWDWNIPSVFNTEITSFILRWEPFRVITMQSFLLKDNGLLTIFFTLHLSEDRFWDSNISLRKKTNYPSVFTFNISLSLAKTIVILLYMMKGYGTGNLLTKQNYAIEISHLKLKAWPTFRYRYVYTYIFMYTCIHTHTCTHT